MSQAWFSPLELPLTLEQFCQLPRNPAYKYEYLRGRVCLSPQPRYFHARLDLSVERDFGAGQAELRLVQESDWTALEEVKLAAFRHTLPFGILPSDQRLEAVRASLKQTRSGGDGPLIGPASFVAFEPATGHRAERLYGAALVTLLPMTDPTSWDGFTWVEPPPPDAIERRLGRPHLTWIFVRPSQTGRGVGAALLQAAVAGLRSLGYDELLSTFVLGNDSSLLWHWRMGFQLLAHPGSLRRCRWPVAFGG